MEKAKDSIYCKGYTQGYLDGYRDGVKDTKAGTDKVLLENDIAKLPIEAMEITARAYNCLRWLRCRHVSNLLYLSPMDLKCAKSLGPKTAGEIAHWLDSHGFSMTAWSLYL